MSTITRKSVITGEVHSMDIPDVTEAYIQAWQDSGELIQDYFPDLTPAQREFLLTGTTQEEWDTLNDHDDDLDE